MRKLYKWYSYKYGFYMSRIHYVLSQKGIVSDWEYRYLTEALMSDIWQSWNIFNRTVVFKSLRGVRLRDGTTFGPRQEDNSWQRLGYEAQAYKRNRNVTANGHINFVMRNEPTWGDLGVFIKIVQGFSPPNAAALLQAYGGNFQGIKHLQMVRNCSAHKNIENYLDIRSLALVYSLPSEITPTTIAWSNKIGSTTLAIESWLKETSLIADMATA